MPLTLVSALRGRPEHVPADFPTDGAATPADGAPSPSALLSGKFGLGPVAARSGAVLRFAWCAVAPVVAYGSGSVAAPSMWGHVLLVGAVLWGVGAGAVCWYGRLPHWLVLGDLAVSAGLLIGMVRLLPAEVVGAAGSWVVG